jgi:hypothetical protein
VSTAEELLLQLDDADQAQRPAREHFYVIPAMSPLPGMPVQGPGLDEDFRCHEQDVDELEEADYLRVEPLTGGGFMLDVTHAGHEHAEKLRLARSGPPASDAASSENALDWETRALPVLRAVARAYSKQPHHLGVSSEAVLAELGSDTDPYAVGLVLNDLVRASYIEETLGTDQHVGPAFCRLAEKGLKVTAGWPASSGEAAFERLISLIDERIEAAPDEEERSRWLRLRDGIAGVGREVVVGVLTTTVNAAVKGQLH